MDWIKKNPAKFALLAAAVLALASAFLVYQRVSSIGDTFEAMRATPPPKAKPEKHDTKPVDDAQKALASPVIWTPPKDGPSLFVSAVYILLDGRLTKPKGGCFQKPVSNDWLEKYKLDFLDKTVLGQDSDKDGFTTLEEWKGRDVLSHLDDECRPVMGPDGSPLPDDSTDPTDAKSHPPYHTKLQLAKVVYIPFRLKFMAWDADPKDPKKALSVQINPLDAGGRSKYVDVGKEIPGTKFKVVGFEKKESPGIGGTMKDTSEVTVENAETAAKVVLPKGIEVNSPDSYAVFRFVWMAPGQESPGPDIPKRRGDTFTLPPEPEKPYKVIDIKGDEAVVELPGGEKRTFKSTDTAPR